MAATGSVELLTKAEVPFYFETNDKVAWVVDETDNLLAIVYTSDLSAETEDSCQETTQEVEVGLKLLNLKTGEIEREVFYYLIPKHRIIQIVCDLTPTSGYPLLNVFACLEDSQSCTFVFSCPCEYEGEEDQLQQEEEVIMSTWDTVSFMKASPLRNGRYWLAVSLDQLYGDELILFEMIVEEISHKSSRFQVHCARYMESFKMGQKVYQNLTFLWTLVDFSPDQDNMAVIGNESNLHVSYTGLVILDTNSFTVIAETELKEVYFVADAKYSMGGNFFLALCNSEINDNDAEDAKLVLIWDTLGNLLQDIDLALPCYNYELCLSPHDDYFAISQSGVDFNGRQVTVFSKHTLNLSKPLAQFDAEEMLRIYHEEGTDDYTRCKISPSGHQVLVTHCWRVEMEEEQREEFSDLLVYKVNTSPADLKILCRVAVTKCCAVQKLTPQDMPGQLLSFLHWY